MLHTYEVGGEREERVALQVIEGNAKNQDDRRIAR